MFGVLATLLFSAGATGFGVALLRRWLEPLDPATRLGAAGMAGLGTLGLLTLPIGLIPGGLRWGVAVVLLPVLYGFYVLFRLYRDDRPRLTVPKGPAALFPLAISVALFLSLVGVLAPSDTLDWDSLAYHLAVPKMWLQAGQIHFVSYIHHSNFPFTIDNLYIWGLWWGGQHGAKAFSLVFVVLGLLSLFGIARQRYGPLAGWWAALVFATIPAVVWLAGTAYIDVSNGLFAGLGILFAARLVEQPKENRFAWLSAVCLGFAAGSKYTGLQTVVAVGLVVLLYALFAKTDRPKIVQPFLIGLVALAIALPWYVKNVVNTGNPVYPFFYGVLGGRNWDEFSARIYTEEQKTFGVGIQQGSDPLQIGHAVLGLAYQPGRYINPNPTQGTGFPFGALGIVILAAGFYWCFSGRIRRFEGASLAVVGFSLLMWFVLSQQSRYIVALAVPLSVLAGGAIVKLKLGQALGGAAVLQAAFSLWLVNTLVTSAQMRPAFGAESREEYLAQRVGFFEPSKVVNIAAQNGKVALYDEVFGFFLDVPYFWANPGHTTELGYDRMENGNDLVAALERLGITHVYLNLGIYSREDPVVQRWLSAMGLTGPAVPYEGREREEMSADLRNKWKVLLADAIAGGKLHRVETFRKSFLFALE
ncbi:MAG TPA: glycosyltransferase family 39 protein [Fimbriimonas sp.]